MVEKTHASQTRFMFSGHYGNNTIGSEFLTIGDDIFESDELTDRLYESYLAMMTDGWTSNAGFKGTINDIGESLFTPFYLPCTKRVVLKGQVDLINDKIPDSCSILERDRRPNNSTVSSVTVRKTVKFPRGYAAPCHGVKVVITMLYEDTPDRNQRKILGKTMTGVILEYAVIKPSGEIVPAVRVAENNNDTGQRVSVVGLMLQAACCCVNANEDKKHLWQVKTAEPFLGKLSLKIDLGCAEEHIKSLFYARSLPVTSTGKRRPILHWVSAHLRRMKEGIDIDVKKHLRGIEEFEMDALRFQICNPAKAT